MGAEEVDDGQRGEPEPDPRLLGMGADGALEMEEDEGALIVDGQRREPVGQGALRVPGVGEVAVGVDGAAPAGQGRPAALAGLGEGPVGGAVLVVAIGVGGVQRTGRVRGWMGVAVHGGVLKNDSKKQAKMSEFVGSCRNLCLHKRGTARDNTDLARPNPPPPTRSGGLGLV